MPRRLTLGLPQRERPEGAGAHKGRPYEGSGFPFAGMTIRRGALARGRARG